MRVKFHKELAYRERESGGQSVREREAHVPIYWQLLLPWLGPCRQIPLRLGVRVQVHIHMKASRGGTYILRYVYHCSDTSSMLPPLPPPPHNSLSRMGVFTSGGQPAPPSTGTCPLEVCSGGGCSHLLVEACRKLVEQMAPAKFKQVN